MDNPQIVRYKRVFSIAISHSMKSRTGSFHPRESYSCYLAESKGRHNVTAAVVDGSNCTCNNITISIFNSMVVASGI